MQPWDRRRSHPPPCTQAASAVESDRSSTKRASGNLTITMGVTHNPAQVPSYRSSHNGLDAQWHTPPPTSGIPLQLFPGSTSPPELPRELFVVPRLIRAMAVACPRLGMLSQGARSASHPCRHGSLLLATSLKARPSLWSAPLIATICAQSGLARSCDIGYFSCKVLADWRVSPRGYASEK